MASTTVIEEGRGEFAAGLLQKHKRVKSQGLRRDQQLIADGQGDRGAVVALGLAVAVPVNLLIHIGEAAAGSIHEGILHELPRLHAALHELPERVVRELPRRRRRGIGGVGLRHPERLPRRVEPSADRMRDRRCSRLLPTLLHPTVGGVVEIRRYPTEAIGLRGLVAGEVVGMKRLLAERIGFPEAVDIGIKDDQRNSHDPQDYA